MRRAVLRADARALAATFGVELLLYRSEGEPATYHGHEGPVRLPAELEGLVSGVFGLHGRAAARPHLRPHAASGPAPPDVAHYTPDALARLYEFPEHADGTGQCIGLVELGGGYRRRDLADYFRSLRLPLPRVRALSVNGGGNRPTGRPMGPDSEVMLDLEVAGAVAPGATLVVYFAPGDERGFVDAVKHAVHDRANRPSVLSLSWGNPEAEWSRAALAAANEAFHEAAALGITICASAGDRGASAGESGLAVEFPASSPYVLGCGGTRLLARAGAIRSEVVWNDLDAGFGATGGGFSTRFARPRFQKGIERLRAKTRGVPDVAGDADPATGYRVKVDGRYLRLGGTSAVAPLWAGLVARLNQALGQRLGAAALCAGGDRCVPRDHARRQRRLPSWQGLERLRGPRDAARDGAPPGTRGPTAPAAALELIGAACLGREH
jgi:kumamolisin